MIEQKGNLEQGKEALGDALSSNIGRITLENSLTGEGEVVASGI